MIVDSHPWRQELTRLAKELRRMGSRRRLDRRAVVRLELVVLSGLYSVWKLVESGLVDAPLVHEPLQLTAFPFRPGDPRRAAGGAAHDYDLNEGRPVRHDVLFLCHQMIHNHTFAPRFSDGEPSLAGIYLTSSHQRRVALYGMDLRDLVGLLERVAGGRISP